jgi:hypothetical protein
MLREGAVLQGRYRVVRKIGGGGMGLVYLAKDENVRVEVAIKQNVFTEERLIEAFKRESRLLAGLRHPALPQVKDYFIDETGQFLVMEYIPGDDFGTILHERKQKLEPAGQPKPFAVDEVLRWAEQLLDALDYLHTLPEPVIHRDIKPQNLKLAGRNQIILLDFGLAKGKPGFMTRVTTTGSLYGYTPNYAPLEQIRGAGTDPRSDLYALGATLYHLLTGTPPVDAATRAEMVLSGEPDPLRPADELNPKVSRGVAEALGKAMAHTRNNRSATAAEMLEMLRGARYATVLGRPVQERQEVEPVGQQLERGEQEGGAREETQTVPEERVRKAAEEEAIVKLREREQARQAEKEGERARRQQELEQREEADRVARRQEELERAQRQQELEQREEADRIARQQEELERAKWQRELEQREEADRVARQQEEIERARRQQELEQREEAKRVARQQEELERAKRQQELEQREEAERVRQQEELERVKRQQEMEQREEAERVARQQEEMERERRQQELERKEEADRVARQQEELKRAKRQQDLEQLEEAERVAREQEKRERAKRELRQRDEAERVVRQQEQERKAKQEAKTVEQREEPIREPRGRQWRIKNLHIVGGVLLVAFVSAIWLIIATTGDEPGGGPSTPPPKSAPPPPVATARLQPVAFTTPTKISEVSLSDDGQILASSGDQRVITLWQASGAKELSGTKQIRRCVALSPDGRFVASGGNDKAILLWTTSDGHLTRTLTGHSDAVFSVGFSLDGQTLFSASFDKTIKLWRVSDGGLIKTVRLPKTGYLIAAVSPDLGLAGFYRKGGEFKLWSLERDAPVRNLDGSVPPVNCGAFSRDGEALVLGTVSGHVELWRVSDGQMMKALANPASPVISVAFSGDGQKVAAGLESGLIKVWRVSDGQLIKTLTGHSKSVNSLSFSADGRTLASGGSDDKTVRIWDVPAN